MVHISRPAVPRRPQQSPYSLTLKVTGEHSLFSYYFHILSFYALVLFTTVSFPLFLEFFLLTRFSVLTPFGLMGPGIEMQLSSYDGWWGCRITMVNCMKDVFYSRSLCTGRYQESWRWLSFFIVILTVIHISDVFFRFRKSWDMGETLYNKSALPLFVRIE